ncbi:integrin alpha-M [Mastacembelus armatus]|uniref:Integrin alpha-M-like n=1 Tax=Mastacembelus armatus TaxID=205130 RepID=A0A3Q3LEH3_9TELE|nr:integrin alpha-M-like [Mastacembelus armatus]
MQGHHHTFLLTYMVAVAIPVSLSFNIDITNPSVHIGERKDFFGYKVLQYMSGKDKGIIVTAPLQLNGSGGVCQQFKNQDHKCFNPAAISLADKTIPVKNFGLTIAADSSGDQFTVCSPNVAHECYENSYVNSVCYKMTYHLQNVSSFKPTFQECTKKTVDLVFLFDGSLSMTTQEFEKNKGFINNIMDSLKNTSIKFAAVQFSSKTNMVFDFNDYQAGRAHAKLEKEKHMKSLTNTHSAMDFVLKTIFENPEAGASPDPTKVLVIITDGDPSDTDNSGVIKKYNEKSIIRFVIGVKDAKLDKFTTIASEPTDKYAFKIENYDGLKGILTNFQKKIFKMEGTKVTRAGNLENEMSQSGLSAVFDEDTLILGSVGSKSWRGSLQQLYGQKEIQIEDPEMEMDSYMGYSVSVGKKNNARLYFTGAPRFEHTGLVVLFRQDGNWTAAQRIYGSQIGSYFGAELCSVDIDSDGNTDFLLVGAPQFYEPNEKREGQIYVYRLTEEMQLTIKLNVTAQSKGRFGTTISSLADLNGDGLRDVAVGAPLEDDNRGAVYIYLGDRHRGIRSTFSQRIMGRKFTPEPRFFGQAIDGGMDLGEDGLPDIVIGSQGMAVVLRSRPVFHVVAHLSFIPKEISTDKLGCEVNNNEILPMVTLKACFEMTEITKKQQQISTSGAASSGLNVSYTIDLDPMRHTYRGLFNKTDRKARSHTSTYELKEKYTCFHYTIYIPKCVKDTLSPITIKLNFSQVDSEKASVVLNADSKKQAAVELPFEKQCRKNDTCIAELEVDFNFMTPTLLVVEDNYFNVSATLSNHGDDSYNTSLTMHYPTGLSFSTMTLTKATRPTLHSCHDLEGVLNKTTCSISLPVYRSRNIATFKISFYIMTDYEWDDTMSMTITGQSDNADSTRNNSLTRQIPVQFEIKMAITVREDTVTYLNFTTDDAASKKVDIIYKIANPGWKSFPVNVSLFYPTMLEYNFEITEVLVHQNKTQCTGNDTTSEYCSAKDNCKSIRCDTFILDKESVTEIKLSGNIQFKDLKELAANIAFLKRYTGDSREVKFKNVIHVSYDDQLYMLDFNKVNRNSFKPKFPETVTNPTMKWTEVRVEIIIPLDERLIILTGVGLGLLLLIIITVIMLKLGCFKRKSLEYYQEQEDEAACQAATNPEYSLAVTEETDHQPKTDDESVKPLEATNLLDNGDSNSNTPVA